MRTEKWKEEWRTWNDQSHRWGCGGWIGMIGTLLLMVLMVLGLFITVEALFLVLRSL